MGGCLREKDGLSVLPFLGKIGLFPRHILGVRAKVTIAGNLAEIRAAQVKTLDDGSRTHIYAGDQLLNLFLCDLLGAERVNQYGNRLGNADGV